MNAAVLLADDAVIGKAGRDGIAHQRFGVAVGVGDKILMALALDGERVDRPEVAERELAGLTGKVESEVEAVLMGRHGGGLREGQSEWSPCHAPAALRSPSAGGKHTARHAGGPSTW